MPGIHHHYQDRLKREIQRRSAWRLTRIRIEA
jgi:hypothetical protein